MTDEQYVIYREYRTFLRTEKGKKKNLLESYVKAIEEKLPALIHSCFNIEIESLYDNSLSVEQLVTMSMKIKSDDELMTTQYISSRALDYYIEYYANKIGADLKGIIDSLQKDEDSDEYVEGEERDQVSIRYERNKRAKEKCIKAKGCKCAVCGFDFEKVYGEAGKGFIEVHHIIPVSKRGGSYVLDPVNDLVPLCSNCHSIVHRKRDTVMEIEELQKICTIKYTE